MDKPLKSVTHGQCDARPTVTFPAAGHHLPLTGTKLYCLVTEVGLHVCEQLAQGCYPKVERPGIEPATVCVASQHRNHYTTRPHYGLKLNSTTRTRTRTRPDTDKVRARCRVRAKFHYTDPTRTRPDPHGPARTFFSSYPTTCADFVRDRTVSSPCRVRVGFVSVSV